MKRKIELDVYDNAAGTVTCELKLDGVSMGTHELSYSPFNSTVRVLPNGNKVRWNRAANKVMLPGSGKWLKVEDSGTHELPRSDEDAVSVLLDRVSQVINKERLGDHYAALVRQESANGDAAKVQATPST